MARVRWNTNALLKAVGTAAQPEVRGAVQRMQQRAQAMGNSYFTGFYHRNHQSPAIGGTQARYAWKMGIYNGAWPVGIVYTANYAAKKDTMLNNTLFKAMG